MSKFFNIQIEHIPIETILPSQNFDSDLSKIRKLGGYFEDYVEILRMEAIETYCNANQITKAILPENAEILASRALNLLCKSRSVEIAKMCSAKFVTEKGVCIGRPFYEISDREMLFFARNNDLFGFVINNSFTFEKNIQKVKCGSSFKKFIAEGSIGILLDQFVEEVQGEYSSTCTTLLRTVAKLDFSDLGTRCRVCRNCFDAENDLTSLVKVKESEEERTVCSGCQIMFDELNY